MDSLPRTRPRWPGTTYLCDFDEASSDFEKALRFVRSMGAEAVWVAGALGGRLDHALMNLSLAEAYSRDLRISLIQDGLAWQAGPGRHSFACAPGQIVSLIPSAAGCRVTTRGLRYALERERLTRGSRGLSNVATAKDVVIEIHSGAAWIVQPAQMKVTRRRH